MKTKVLTRLLLAGGCLAAAPLWAAWEPVRIEVTEEPLLPARLTQEGVQNGRVVIALSVDSDGQLTDSLVLSASHAELVKSCTEALTRWRFKPARLDGQPTAAHLELSINVSQEHAVISSVAIDTARRFIEQLTGRPDDIRLCRPDEMDRPLLPVVRAAPPYGGEAEKGETQGRVRVQFYVDQQGRVRLPSVPAESDSHLSALAVDAISRWQFEPPTRGGNPAVVAVVQEFEFGGPIR